MKSLGFLRPKPPGALHHRAASGSVDLCGVQLLGAMPTQATLAGDIWGSGISLSLYIYGTGMGFYAIWVLTDKYQYCSIYVCVYTHYIIIIIIIIITIL